MSQDYLQHYGIKGQKWGIRRFQNEDGSYTSAGKERYGYTSDGRAGSISSSGKSGDVMSALFTQLAIQVGVKSITNHIRSNRIRKELEKNEINKDSERITKANVKSLAASSLNKKERAKLYDIMLEDQNIDFKKAYAKIAEEHNKRILRNTLIFMAAKAAVTLAIMYRNPIMNTIDSASNAVKRNKTYQDLMQKIRLSKMKDVYVNSDSDFKILSDRALPG